mmetsp:Transcript_22639/g.70870  ORF Transcript_22639/g.70870 Transcript_22639/m.70870 type:complete len:443 (+) Transcript_22639:533-1861(+)
MQQAEKTRFFRAVAGARAALVDVVLDEEGLFGGGLAAGHVGPAGGFGVGPGAGEELLLRSLDVGGLAVPDLETGALEGAGEGEGEAPGADAVDLVDFREVDGGVFFRDAAGQEGDAGDGGGEAALQGAHGELGDLGRICLVGAVDAGHGHGGLDDGALEEDAVLLEALVDGGHDAFLDPGRGVEIVVAVDEDLGLDDGDETAVLADASVASEIHGGDVDGEVGGGGGVDLEGGAPLGEARAANVVPDASLVEGVESRAPLLAFGAADEVLEAHVDLDAGSDAFFGEEVDEGAAVGIRLEERLLEEDGAADVLLEARGGEEEVSPGLPVGLGVLEADRLEALPDRPRRLVAGEETLPGRHHRASRGSELVGVLGEGHFQSARPRHRGAARRRECSAARRGGEGDGDPRGHHHHHRVPLTCASEARARWRQWARGLARGSWTSG